MISHCALGSTRCTAAPTMQPSSAAWLRHLKCLVFGINRHSVANQVLHFCSDRLLLLQPHSFQSITMIPQQDVWQKSEEQPHQLQSLQRLCSLLQHVWQQPGRNTVVLPAQQQLRASGISPGTRLGSTQNRRAQRVVSTRRTILHPFSGWS